MMGLNLMSKKQAQRKKGKPAWGSTQGMPMVQGLVVGQLKDEIDSMV